MRGLGCPRKFSYSTKSILRSQVLGLMIWNETTLVNKHGVQTALLQLFVSYLRARECPGTRAVVVKTDDYWIQRKLSCVCHEYPAGTELESEALSISCKIAVLKRRAILHKTTITSCIVKLCDQNVLTIMIYFRVFFIFVVYTNHENIFTTKISRSSVRFLCMQSMQLNFTCCVSYRRVGRLYVGMVPTRNICNT